MRLARGPQVRVKPGPVCCLGLDLVAGRQQNHVIELVGWNVRVALGRGPEQSRGFHVREIGPKGKTIGPAQETGAGAVELAESSKARTSFFELAYSQTMRSMR